MRATGAVASAGELDERGSRRIRIVVAAALALSATALVDVPPVALPGLASGASTDAQPAVTEAFGELPLSFVENRGQGDSNALYTARGPGYAFAFAPDEVAMSLGAGHLAAPDAAGPSVDNVALSWRFLGADPDVEVAGAQRTPGVVNHIHGDDPAGWQTGLPTFAAVRYEALWPGVDLVVRGDAGELKYEFLVAPGARPDDIRLAYAGASGLALDGEGGLLVGTPHGDLRDAPPIAYQEVGGERVPVDVHYLLSEGGRSGEYGFALGADYRPDHPLVIDPALDYSTLLGGSSHELAAGVAVDTAGNAIVVGTTQSDDFPATAGAVDRTFNGGVVDVFVAKLKADGSGLVYATYLGGTPTPLRRGSGDPVEFGRAVAVDGDGNAYVTGQTTSSDFPTTSGSFQPNLNATPDDATDAFVTKLDTAGSLVYSTFLGGGSWEDGRDIAVDASGNASVVGETGSGDFPTTSAAVQTTASGGRDAFVATLNGSGSSLLGSTYLGGADNDTAAAVAVDGDGNTHVAGSTRSIEFPTTPGAFQPTHSGGGFADLFEVFAAKLPPGASALSYSTFLGGTKMDLANDVAVDAAGHAHVTGGTLSPEYPTTGGAHDTLFDATSESFVTKLQPDGGGLAYSTFLRGGTFITLDADGSAWVAGGTGAGAFTSDDAFATESSGGTDAYLARLNPAGSGLEFATYLGGNDSDRATGVALAADGAVYVGGNTLSADFPTTTGAFDRTWAGDVSIFWGDAFLARFGGDGDGGDTTPPPAEPETATFSGRIDENETRTHNLAIAATGAVELALDWERSRANLALRVRDPSGATVFSDTSSAKPKTGAFTATTTGTYRFEVTNTSRRDTDYSLSVTYPAASGGSEPEPSATLSTLSLAPTSVTGGESSTGTVTLTAGAPAGGASVLLSSSDTGAATVPSSVTVPEGQTRADFAVSTSSVSADAAVTISATYGGVTRTAALTVQPAAAPALSRLDLDPTTVTGGASSTGTVTLTAPASSGGAAVALGSSNTDVATVPPSVTVAAGQTRATFTVSSSPQEFDQSSAISASYGGASASVILSVTASASADTVTISRAEYDEDKEELRVEAASSESGATLRVYETATDALIGTLSGGRGEFSWPRYPDQVTVRSDLGGAATSHVERK